jgi:hypothetical protein
MAIIGRLINDAIERGLIYCLGHGSSEAEGMGEELMEAGGSTERVNSTERNDSMDGV